MENPFEKYRQQALENPEQFLKEMGIDPNIMNSEELKNLVNLLKSIQPAIKLEGEHFERLKNFEKKSEFSDKDKEKLQKFGVEGFYEDLIQKMSFCFIGKACDTEIIGAHSSGKGELSLIAEKHEVFQFSLNTDTGKKEIGKIAIRNASTFKGFCQTHDNDIFEPIDKKHNIPLEQQYFLFSFRSFAYSYHNIKSYQDYIFKKQVLPISNALNPTIDVVKKMLDLFGLNNLFPELNNAFTPQISEEELHLLELKRFEEHRQKLIGYLEQKDYIQLDYFIYETNHLCPVVCSSWVIKHATLGNGFIVIYDGKKFHNGFPILISIIPKKNKTKLILARFKTDELSELIFDRFKQFDKEGFEKEISKLLIERVDNFYLAPKFWNNLSEEKKENIHNAINRDKKQSLTQNTDSEIFNFFDSKYQIN